MPDMTLKMLPTALLLLITISASFPARCAVNCNVTSTGVAFGTYAPFQASDDNVVGQVTVSCSGNAGDPVNYAIGLSAGSNSYLSRSMTSGSNGLGYNLYTDAPHTTLWGDGSAGTATVNDSYSFPTATTVQRSYTIYGRLPMQQTLAHTGSYTDTLIVTLNY